jgi:hypothetical protein
MCAKTTQTNTDNDKVKINVFERLHIDLNERAVDHYARLFTKNMDHEIQKCCRQDSLRCGLSEELSRHLFYANSFSAAPGTSRIGQAFA